MGFCGYSLFFDPYSQLSQRFPSATTFTCPHHPGRLETSGCAHLLRRNGCVSPVRAAIVSRRTNRTTQKPERIDVGTKTLESTRPTGSGDPGQKQNKAKFL